MNAITNLMVNFICHTAATDMYRKQDRQNKHMHDTVYNYSRRKIKSEIIKK